MQRLASWIARRLWWGSLWLMRRPPMRRLQRASMRWMGPERADRAYRGLVRQNALARRVGLPIIRALILAVLVSLLLQMVYSAALALVESGVLRPRRLEESEPW